MSSTPLAAGVSAAEIVEHCPTLTVDDVRAARGLRRLARQAGDPRPVGDLVKIKLDENITDAKHLFVAHGHQCHTVPDKGLTGAPDAKLVDACRSEQRMLVTFDLGFGDVRVYPPSQYAAIVLLRLRDQQPNATLHVLQGLLATRDLAELAHRLTVVAEDRVRVRSD